MQSSPGEMKNLQIGFIFLILFCVFRPLSLLKYNIAIAGLNFLEIFSILISYLLLVVIAINFRKMKFDFISISILYYCSYCFISIFWGSKVEFVARVTLPFVFFFAIRVIINEPKQVKLLLTVLILGYCFPLVGSFYQIIQGVTATKVESITGIERHAGLFLNIRVFSYAMFFISVFFYIQVIINQLRSRQIKLALLCLLIISLFCLFKTYARTAFIGLAIFWGISLFGYKKKYFVIVLISSLIIGVLYLSTLQQIFFKTKEFNASTASSGRSWVWEHNFNFF